MEGNVEGRGTLGKKVKIGYWEGRERERKKKKRERERERQTGGEGDMSER